MIFPKLAPFIVTEIIDSDSFYTHYRAEVLQPEEPQSYIITEFNPSFMVQRAEDGVLVPTDRFVTEFGSALERFVTKAEAFKVLDEPFIAPPHEILQLNNTAYTVRQEGRYKSLHEGLQVKKMNYFEAYTFTKPLLQNLITASKQGILFEFKTADLQCTTYGQLILDSMVAWEGNYIDAIVEVTKILYRLIAGVQYNPELAENPAVKDIGMPSRLTTMMEDILAGESAYGSIDDFSKQLRSEIDAAAKKDGLNKKAKNVEVGPATKLQKRTVILIMSGVVASLFLLVAGPIIWLNASNRVVEGDLLYVGILDDFIEELYTTEYPTELPPEPVFVRYHTAYAVTDPRDDTVMLNGSFLQRGDSLFYSGFYNNGHALLANTAESEGNVVVPGVRPAFMQAHGGYIYFSDGANDYNIRRVRYDGSGLETVSTDTASSLLIYRNWLFYTNHNNRDFLYRLDLTTLESELFENVSAYEMYVHEGLLYFVNGSSGFRIYSVSAGGTTIRLNDTNSDNLRINDEYIFYRDAETGYIYRLSRVQSVTPIQAASFDMLGDVLAIIEQATNELIFFNINTEELTRTGVKSAYAYMVEGGAYALNYNDTTSITWVPITEPQPEEAEEI